jgi:Antibiotic biosynthesis monooxygenase
MQAFNVVRFRVRPGMQQEFIEVHRSIRPMFKGYLGGDLIQTGEQTFCVIGKWRDMNALVAARPEMIAVLDGLRHLLEDLGSELGVTDAISGETVASFAPPAEEKSGKKKDKKKEKKKEKGKGKSKSRKKTKSQKKSEKKGAKRKSSKKSGGKRKK